ncbi:MAG: hypothetical protein WA231_12395, partial [Methylocella sp.]
MVYPDSKAAEEFIKAFAPSEEDKRKFAQTFLGSVIGQTAILACSLAVYALAIAVLRKYFWAETQEFRDAYGIGLFALLVTAPFIIILAFSAVPTSLRARRESRLKRAAITGNVRFRPGYFRLTPYGQADGSAFRRLDGEDDRVRCWLTSTQESLLYLSGASGVGKSSIMAAGVGPTLLELGWTIVETRIFGEPVQRVRRTLLEAKGLFEQNPDADMDLRSLLTRAAEARTKEGGAPLLLIIDQFEEFLILNKTEQQAPFAAFLQELAAAPIDGLRVLLVYRSDYRPLIFKLALPLPTDGKNWIDIAPYNRGEATAFLQGGGRRFSEEALDDLFRGLDRIEEARGIYRLVTLNMVGLILERMGQRIEVDPKRLIQDYLMRCLTSGDGHEFARPLLEHMITDTGTKEPQTESALAALTGLEWWKVVPTLQGLAKQGLVRKLEIAEPAWEISHDFLARTIGRLIGRLRPSLFRRAQPFV